MVVVSKVRAHARFRVGSDAIEGLSGMVGEVTTRAVALAQADKMETVKVRHVKAAIQQLLETKGE